MKRVGKYGRKFWNDMKNTEEKLGEMWNDMENMEEWQVE